MRNMGVVAYAYKADIYCPVCIINEVLRDTKVKSWRLNYITTEGDLKRIARIIGIDYENDSSYDSDDFPKVILSWEELDDEHCCKCHTSI